MSKTVKVPAKKVSVLEPEEVASNIVKDLKPQLVSKRDADALIKPLKEQLIQLISDNKDLFLPEGAKSCTVDGVLVSITTEASYSYGEEFDLVKFYKKFPNAIKFEFKTSEMKNIDLNSHGVNEVRKPKNTVELIKKTVPVGV